MSKLREKTLIIEVLDADRFSRDDILGEVCLPLQEINFSEGSINMTHYLQPSAKVIKD